MFSSSLRAPSASRTARFAGVASSRRAHAAAMAQPPRRGLLRVSASVASPGAGTFTQENLTDIAREFVERGSGYFSAPNEDLLHPEFVFRGPIVGPLNKADYLTVLNNNKIYEAWPDINPNAQGFFVDEDEPNRVWFMTRVTGTNTGPLRLGPRIQLPPSGRRVSIAPEMHSVLIDEATGKIKMMTFGYVCDYDSPRATNSMTGGLFALLNAAGVPAPSAGTAGKVSEAIGEPLLGIKSVSDDRAIPAWYKTYQRGEVRRGMEGTP